MVDFDKIYKEISDHFPCEKGCNDCCNRAGEIVLLPGEPDALVKKVPSAQSHIYFRRYKKYDIGLIRQPCPFLRKGSCSIERQRPFDCRIYPFDWCVDGEQQVVFLSRDCAGSRLGKERRKGLFRTISLIMKEFDPGWLKIAATFGPCGKCPLRREKRCALYGIKGSNTHDW